MLASALFILSRHQPYRDLGPAHFDPLDSAKLAKRLVKRSNDFGLQVDVRVA